MNQISGTVVGLSSTPIMIKTGPRAGQQSLKHFVTVQEGASGQLVQIGVGFNQPYSVGQQLNNLPVEFKYGGLQVVKPAKGGAAVVVPQPQGTVIPFPAPVGGAPTPALPAPAPASPPARGRGPFPIDKASGEQSIIRQNALTNARELVTHMDPVKDYDPRTPLNVRRQILDEITEDILYVAYKFAEFSSGQREARIARDKARVNPPSASASDTDSASEDSGE